MKRDTQRESRERNEILSWVGGGWGEGTGVAAMWGWGTAVILNEPKWWFGAAVLKGWGFFFHFWSKIVKKKKKNLRRAWHRPGEDKVALFGVKLGTRAPLPSLPLPSSRGKYLTCQGRNSAEHSRWMLDLSCNSADTQSKGCYVPQDSPWTLSSPGEAPCVLAGMLTCPLATSSRSRSRQPRWCLRS